MEPVIEVRDLTVEFATAEGVVHAVTDVSYTLSRGETLGIVGESGSGKSVHVLAMVGLIPSPPGRVARGKVLFEGRDLLVLSDEKLRTIRGRKIGFIFQDPMTSINPVLTIGRQITETMEQHLGYSAARARHRAIELMELVRIPDAENRLDQYPHEFSGGMRQRVMIAMALSCDPKVLVADEPTTALDVTIQAEIIELIREIKRTRDMSVIWITHDLGVVAGIADNIQVMYAGRIMERGPVDDVFADPRSAYTLGLLRSLPHGQKAGERRLRQINGAPPDLRLPGSGRSLRAAKPLCDRALL